MFAIEFLFRNILYLLFSIVMGYFGYRMYKLKKAGFIVFFIVWMLPYYDLFIQKAVKTYYETFKMNNTIYAYPQKDENGKIESLGVYKNAWSKPDSYLYNKKELTKFKDRFAKNISDFIEYYFFESLEFKKRYDYEDFGYARVYFNKAPIKYDKLDSVSEFHSRFQVKATVYENLFYKKISFDFWDTKKNILLAKAFQLSFYPKNYDNKFRNRFLLWKGDNDICFSLKRFDTSNKTYNELFFNSKNKNIKKKDKK